MCEHDSGACMPVLADCSDTVYTGIVELLFSAWAPTILSSKVRCLYLKIARTETSGLVSIGNVLYIMDVLNSGMSVLYIGILCCRVKSKGVKVTLNVHPASGMMIIVTSCTVNNNMGRYSSTTMGTCQ